MSKRIILIDDEKLARKSLGAFLQNRGILKTSLKKA